MSLSVRKGRSNDRGLNGTGGSIEEIFTHVGTASSIIGLILTGFVFYNVSSIKKKFLYQATMPELLKNLADLVQRLGALLNEFEDNRREVPILFSRLKPLLQNLENKASNEQKGMIKNLFQQIERGIDSQDIDLMWKIYYDLQSLQESLRLKLEDDKWS